MKRAMAGTMWSGTWVVTGAAGFVGARIVEALRVRGGDVVSVDFPEAFARPEHAGVDFGRRVHPDELVAFLEREGGVRAVIHLGACTDTMELDEALLATPQPRRTRSCSGAGARRAASRSSTRAARRPTARASTATTTTRRASPSSARSIRTASRSSASTSGRSREERAGQPPAALGRLQVLQRLRLRRAPQGPDGERRPARASTRSADGGVVGSSRATRPGIADGEQKRDFVFVDDVVDVAASRRERRHRARHLQPRHRARAHVPRPRARDLRARSERAPRIEFIDMPDALRERYQYFTEARHDALRAAGRDTPTPFTSLEDGVASYVERLLRGRHEDAHEVRDRPRGRDAARVDDEPRQPALRRRSRVATTPIDPDDGADDRRRASCSAWAASSRRRRCSTICAARSRMRGSSSSRRRPTARSSSASRSSTTRVYVDDATPTRLAATTGAGRRRAPATQDRSLLRPRGVLGRRVDPDRRCPARATGAASTGRRRVSRRASTPTSRCSTRAPRSPRSTGSCTVASAGERTARRSTVLSSCAPEDEAQPLRRRSRSTVSTSSARYVVVNANASDLLLERRWPTERYVALIQELTRRGERVVLIGAPSEAEYVAGIVHRLARRRASTCATRPASSASASSSR